MREKQKFSKSTKKAEDSLLDHLKNIAVDGKTMGFAYRTAEKLRKEGNLKMLDDLERQKFLSLDLTEKAILDMGDQIKKQAKTATEILEVIERTEDTHMEDAVLNCKWVRLSDVEKALLEGDSSKGGDVSD